MNIRVFKGSFFEIGQQQGEVYKTNKMILPRAKTDQFLYKNQFKVYKKYYPELLEEFKGIAKGGNFDEEN